MSEEIRDENQRLKARLERAENERDQYLKTIEELRRQVESLSVPRRNEMETERKVEALLDSFRDFDRWWHSGWRKA